MKLKGRMDTGKLEDLGGVEIDLLEHPVVGDAWVKRHPATKKKMFRGMAGSKIMWEELQMTLLRLHEDAPIGSGGDRALGVDSARLILN